MCKSKRSKAVIDPKNHKFEITNDSKCLDFHIKSKLKFSTKLNDCYEMQNASNYSNWADKRNFGIVHLVLILLY